MASLIAFIDRDTVSQLLTLPSKASIVASVINKQPYTRVDTVFELLEDKNISLLSTGELYYQLIGSQGFRRISWDGIEVYFDGNNDKKTFNASSDDGQYIFGWQSPGISGLNNGKTNGIEYKIKDSSDTSYTVEIKFPWKTLGLLKPTVGAKIGFNIVVNDNDYNNQTYNIPQKRWPSKFAWHSKTNDVINSIHYGTMVLGGYNKDSSFFIARHTKQPIIVDGITERAWLNMDSINIKNSIGYGKSNAKSLNASAKTCFDKVNLYIMVTVNDDWKQYYPSFTDYGWIEDMAGNVKWTMSNTNDFHIGGALKNRGIKSSVFLKKGKYRMVYINDESHSWKNWDDDAPRSAFWGIIAFTKRS